MAASSIYPLEAAAGATMATELAAEDPACQPCRTVVLSTSPSIRCRSSGVPADRSRQPLKAVDADNPTMRLHQHRLIESAAAAEMIVDRGEIDRARRDHLAGRFPESRGCKEVARRLQDAVVGRLAIGALGADCSHGDGSVIEARSSSCVPAAQLSGRPRRACADGADICRTAPPEAGFPRLSANRAGIPCRAGIRADRPGFSSGTRQYESLSLNSI